MLDTNLSSAANGKEPLDSCNESRLGHDISCPREKPVSVSAAREILERMTFVPLLPLKKLNYDDDSLASMISAHRRSRFHPSVRGSATNGSKDQTAKAAILEGSYRMETTGEPLLKRRKFQRRNSKTAAMLSISLTAMGVMGASESQHYDEVTGKNASDLSVWDEGLETAEEIFRQAQKLRRQGFDNTS